MANAASTIEIELEIRDAINRLGRLERELTKSSQSFDRAAQATRKFEGAINKAKAGMVAFFAAISIQKLAQLSDAMTQFENRVKLATNSLVQQLAVQQQLFQVAQKTALPLEDVGQLYSRLRIAAEQLGASQRDLINLTETVGLALKASGTSAASAQGALLQLGQALNSPRVQAEEFNSLIDGMPNLLREVEKQLGLTAGGLKKFVTDGQLSNKKFFDAILASQKALTQQANSSASTIEQANQRVANSFTSLIGAIDDKLGASKFFTGFIDGLASGIDKLSNFLGLTTQATGGGGGGANLDEVIRGAAPSGSQYAFPTIGPERITESIGRFPNYVQEINSLEELISLEEDLLFIREDQAKQIGDAVNSNKETVEILGTQNVPLKEAVGYINFENKLLDSIIQKRRIELQQNKENLTYLEQATNYLKEQFGLTDRTAGAIVSGISAAGPNASRGMNIAQSKSLDEAAYKLILSNEKVAAAIDKSFELLFDVLDPFIDILGDLLSAINRLIGALLENVTSGIENALDQIGLGPNSYLFGGGFTQDIESVIGGSGYSSPDSVAIQQLSFEELVEAFPEDELILRINNAIQKGTTQLAKDDPLIQTLVALAQDSSFEEVMQQVSATIEEVREVQEVVANFTQSDVDELMAPANQLVEAITKTLPAAIAEANVPESLDTLEEITETAIRQTEAIEFQNLTVEEQIQFRYDEAIATIEQQRALADLIDDEELRSQLLDSVNRATQSQNDLLAKQQEELKKLNEEREREARLLAIQNIETGLQGLLRDFERTIEDIGDLVQGLFDQVNDLLFSEFNLASPQEAFGMASDEYQDLLGKAFEPEATEEDIKNLQGFVNEYLSASRDVYKSSSAFQEIFDNVLQDLTKLGISYGFNAPLNAVSGLQKDLETILVDLPEDLQQAVSDLISGLNLAATAFAQQQVEFLTTVYQIPLTLNKENFNISLPIVELGEIQVDFDTYEFANELGLLNLNVENGINNLNKKISSAINSFIQTINNASSAVESGGTATPVETVTPSGTNQSGEVYTPPTYATKIYELAASGAMIDYTNVSDLSNSDSYFYIQRTATDHGSTTVEDYAKAFVASYEDAFGVGAAAKFKYGLYSDFGLSRYFIGYTNTTEGIQARDSNYEAYKNYSTKYGFRHGGIVDAMDTIPAMLSPGEYILSPETVRRYGVSNLNRLNSGDSAAINATSDPEVKRLLAELIVAVRENDTEVNVYTDMQGQTKAGIEEFRSELRERTRRQGDKFLPARYI